MKVAVLEDRRILLPPALPLLAGFDHEGLPVHLSSKITRHPDDAARTCFRHV